MSENNDIKNIIEASIQKIEKVSEYSLSVKQQLIDKMLPIIEKMNLDPDNDSAKLIEAKVNLINSLSSLLSDYEKQYRDTMKLKINTKAEENDQSNVAAIITEFLSKLDTNQIFKSIYNNSSNNESNTLKISEDIDKNIDETLNENNIEIQEEECSPINVSSNIKCNEEEGIQMINDILKTDEKEGNDE